MSTLPVFGAGLVKNGRFYERNQYLLRSAYRGVYDPAAPLDAKDDTTAYRGSVTKDVSFLRIDHVSIEGELPGVWQAVYIGNFPRR